MSKKIFYLSILINLIILLIACFLVKIRVLFLLLMVLAIVSVYISQIILLFVAYDLKKDSDKGEKERINILLNIDNSLSLNIGLIFLISIGNDLKSFAISAVIMLLLVWVGQEISFFIVKKNRL